MTTATVARVLTKTAKPWAHVKWFQKGFGRAFGSVPAGSTPRNPMGQIDGTVNPKEPEEWAEQVWIDSSDPALKNSSIMVVRRISLDLDSWEELNLEEREMVIGRRYDNGAPLSGGDSEFDEEDMDAVDADGNYLIHRQSHLALSREQDASRKMRCVAAPTPTRTSLPETRTTRTTPAWSGSRSRRTRTTSSARFRPAWIRPTCSMSGASTSAPPCTGSPRARPRTPTGVRLLLRARATQELLLGCTS